MGSIDKNKKWIGLATLFFFLGQGVSLSAETFKDPAGLLNLDLEDLGEIVISTVSKKEESLFNSASAVYVISSEDIRRSGVTTIPEALRMAPGVEVARLDGNKWAISVRGFSELFSTKLLIMIDGRSVYTPLFAGVYWDMQDTLLEDVERIEVVRGPGGTLWGANAVNGVVNIITKQAEDTQGVLATASMGNVQTSEGAVRYGDKLGENAYYRTYMKYAQHGEFNDSLDKIGGDGWNNTQGGFRVDWNPSENNRFTFLGNGYSGKSGQRRQSITQAGSPFFTTSDEDILIHGGNLQAEWKRTLSPTSDIQSKIYFDQTNRQDRVLGQTINTVDFEFQHGFQANENHELIWGFGQRVIWDDMDDTFTISFKPEERVDSITNVFVQDKIPFLDNKVHLTLGSKLEWNTMTEFEVQPSVRLSWLPHDSHFFWGAVSRAVRTPSRVEDSSRLNFTGFFNGANNVNALIGDGTMDSEKLIAFETGYRFRPDNTFLLDVTAFFNQYDELRTSESKASFTETIPGPVHTVNPRMYGNNMEGEAYGVEMTAQWKALEWWELNAGFTWFQLHLHLDPSSSDTTAELAEGNSPEYRFHLRSNMDLTRQVEFDTAMYFVDELSNQKVDSYVRFDARLGWKPTDTVEISLSGQNLFDPDHPEFGQQNGIFSTEVPRTLLGKLTLRY